MPTISVRISDEEKRALDKREELLEGERTITADLAVYEVANSIWKHQFILKDIDDGPSFLSIFYELIESGAISIIRYTKKTLRETYDLAGKHKISVYDATFLHLALETGLELRSIDARLLRIFNSEAC